MRREGECYGAYDGGLTFYFLGEIQDTHSLNYSGIKTLKELIFTVLGVGKGGKSNHSFWLPLNWVSTLEKVKRDRKTLKKGLALRFLL